MPNYSVSYTRSGKKHKTIVDAEDKNTAMNCIDDYVPYAKATSARRLKTDKFSSNQR